LITALEIAAAPANLPPVANDDTAETPEIIPVIIPVLDNDGDPEGDSLIITSVGTGNDGTTDIVDGTITYQPNPGFTGEDSFSYTIADSAFSETAGTDSATVTVTVTDATPPVVTAPVGFTTEATGPLTAVNIGVATATDNSDLPPIITSDAPAAYPLGDTTVTWTATDADGNFATDTQIITLVDETAPTFDPIADL